MGEYYTLKNRMTRVIIIFVILFSEMFVSELIGKPVLDRFEEKIGRVKDILANFGQAYPKVSGLLIEVSSGGKNKVLLVGDIDMVGRQFVSTKTVKDRMLFSEIRPDDVLLGRDILDKQIVDVKGARIVRVNDIQLAKVENEIRLIAVDIGILGMLRRLGLGGIFKYFCGLLRIKVEQSLIGWNHVQFLLSEKSKAKLTIPHNRVAELHPSDIASIISHVHTKQKKEIFSDLPDKTAAEALHELSPKIQAYLLTTIENKKAINILEKMPSDEAADVLGDVPEEKAQEFLRLMKKKRANEISQLMLHRDETAGGLMTTEFITFPQDMTVEETINKLRETAPSAETIYYLYVVDEAKHMKGVLSLRNLIISNPSMKLADMMIKDIKTVSAEDNQKHVADMISKYNLLAVPVINKDGEILGIVTVDDVIDLVVPTIARRKRQMLG